MTCHAMLTVRGVRTGGWGGADSGRLTSRNMHVLQIRAENIEADDFDIQGLVLGYHRGRKRLVRAAPTVNWQKWSISCVKIVWANFKIIADF